MSTTAVIEYITKSILICWGCLCLGILCAAEDFYRRDIERPADFFMRGDINIGAITPAMVIDEATKTCVITDYDLSPWQQLESMIMAIDDVNEDDKILPGITLGLTAVESCLDDGITTTQAERLKPANSPSRDEFSVVGVVTYLYSSTIVNMSHVLDDKNIPNIAVDSSSDELSNKIRFPYFFRLVPGDNVQMRIVMAFMQQQNWSYFSLIYENDSYGHSARRGIMNYIDDFGLCVANVFEVEVGDHQSMYERIVSTLAADSDRARVAFVISERRLFKRLLEASYNLNSKGHIVWIGADDITTYLPNADDHLQEYINGMFSSALTTYDTMHFVNHFRTLTPSSNPKNPFFKKSWEMLFECSLKDDPECDKHADVTKSKLFSLAPAVPRSYDATKTFTEALELIRKNHCQQNSKTEVVNCIVNYAQTKTKMERCPYATRNKKNECWLPGLVYYLNQVSFKGATGMVHFDEYGDRNSPFDIYQYPETGRKKVRQVFVELTGKTVIDDIDEVTWEYLAPSKFNRTDDPIEPGDPPISACIVCCQPSEIIMKLDPICCQRNTQCSSKLSIEKDDEYCEACRFYEWPDPKSNYSQCAFIRSHLDNPLSYIIFALSGCGVLISIWILVTIAINNESIVIRLWARELSYIGMVALLVGFANNMLTFAPHNKLTCLMDIFFRAISETGIFDTLFFKTLRVYRVFNATILSNQSMRLVSPKSQMVMALSLIFAVIVFQLILLDYDNILEQDEMSHDGYLYLTCSYGWATETVYHFVNIAVILGCIFFAFQNRHLPKRFREPHHTWIAFIISTIIWYTYEILILYYMVSSYTSNFLLATMRFLFYASAIFFLYYFRMRDLYRSIKK